jgi:hypothetical protein
MRSIIQHLPFIINYMNDTDNVLYYLCNLNSVKGIFIKYSRFKRCIMRKNPGNEQIWL